MNETGVVKFKCEHLATEQVEFAGFAELNACRNKLRDLGYIGADGKGIGFGNVSIRDGASDSFYITGSGTGTKPKLKAKDYAKVTSFDFERNWLRCEGAVVASSESLTHAVIYQAAPEAGAVIHCHDADLWSAVVGKMPTTSVAVEYGTPAMAREVQRLLGSPLARERRLFVMGGHPEGILVFGQSVTEALATLISARAEAKG